MTAASDFGVGKMIPVVVVAINAWRSVFGIWFWVE
jgi:hypothetical protein